MIINILLIVVLLMILAILFLIFRKVEKIKRRVEISDSRKKILDEKQEKERVKLVKYFREVMQDKKLGDKEKEKIIYQSLNWFEKRWS